MPPSSPEAAPATTNKVQVLQTFHNLFSHIVTVVEVDAQYVYVEAEHLIEGVITKIKARFLKHEVKAVPSDTPTTVLTVVAPQPVAPLVIAPAAPAPVPVVVTPPALPAEPVAPEAQAPEPAPAA